MLSLVKQSQQDVALSIEPSVVSAYGQLLANTQLDLALVAETWILPSESEIGHAMDTVDVEGVKIARDFMKKSLAAAHEKLLVSTYERLQKSDAYQITPEAMAARKLANVCMDYLTTLETEAHIERAHTQLKQASNMTDEIAALSAIANISHGERQIALDAFAQRWKENLLVMNKWFAVQAGASVDDTLENVIQLQEHLNYDPVNPNKVRALVAILSRNQNQFHRQDGKGYAFIADQVLAADKRNPGLSGRLVGAFNDWKRFDADRRELMKEQLLRIQGTPGLSANVLEVVDRALKH